MHAQSHIQQRQVKSARVVGPEHPSQCPGSADTSTEKSYPVGISVSGITFLHSYIATYIGQYSSASFVIVIVDSRTFIEIAFT